MLQSNNFRSNASNDNSALDGLQSEIEFYRQNQMIVEQEIKTLISDNEKLSQQVGILLKEKLENARKSQESEENIEVEDLQRQVILITKERDSLHVLWRTSQKTIEALEAELKTYNSEHNPQNNNIESRNGLELKLETALNDYIELESKYKHLNTKTNVLENEIKNKENEIKAYIDRSKILQDKIEELTRYFDECKTRLAGETKSNEDLKKQLVLSQKECVSYVKKEAEAKSKVAEALQLFDLVMIQRDEAYKKITESTEKLCQVKQILANIKQEMENQHRKELDDVKEKYNEKISDMLTHLQNLDAELVEKGLLLNQSLRENTILRTVNENYLKEQKECLSTMDPRLALAEQRLEAMYQELVSSERRNIQLVCEKQCIVLDLQRVQDVHARDNKRREWEESLLKGERDELRVQVDHLQKSLDDTHEMVNKLQRILSSRSELNHKMVTTKEEELTELNKHLENQMELNKKWKVSYVDMTEKLKKRLFELQSENNALRVKLDMPLMQSGDEDCS